MTSHLFYDISECVRLAKTFRARQVHVSVVLTLGFVLILNIKLFFVKFTPIWIQVLP